MYSDTVIGPFAACVWMLMPVLTVVIGEASGWAPDCGLLREMHGLASLPEAHSWIHKASFYFCGYCGVDQNIVNIIQFH